MISPVFLSVLFLILTLFIVLGWTRVILGSANEDEEILNTLRRQMSSLASFKVSEIPKYSETSIDSLPSSSLNSCTETENLEIKSGKQNCASESSSTVSSNNSSSCSSFCAIGKDGNKINVSDKIEKKFCTYIKEIDKMMKEKQKKGEQIVNKDGDSRESTPEKKLSELDSHSYITVKVKKSPTVCSYLGVKNGKCKTKSSSIADKKEGPSLDGSFITGLPVSDIPLKKHRSRSPAKKEWKDVPKNCEQKTNTSNESLNIKSSSSNCSCKSQKSLSKLEEVHCKTEPLLLTSRDTSLINKFKKPDISVRKFSSDEAFFKKSSNKDVKPKEKTKKNITFNHKYNERNKGDDRNNILSSNSAIFYSGREPNTINENRKDIKRRKGSPYRIRSSSHSDGEEIDKTLESKFEKRSLTPELNITDNEYKEEQNVDNASTQVKERNKTKKNTKIPTSKWKDSKPSTMPQKEIVQLTNTPCKQRHIATPELTTPNLSSLTTEQCSSIFQDDFKKLSQEFQMQCSKNFEQNFETKFLTQKIQLTPDPIANNSIADLPLKPTPPKKFFCSNRSFNRPGINCKSECMNKKPPSPTKRSRSRSYGRMKSASQEMEDVNSMCLNNNAYDVGLILMDSPDEMMNDYLYGSKTIPKPKTVIQKPMTSDKSIEAKISRSREKSKDTVESQTISTLNTSYADSTQTSLPKLAIQHIESYCEPVDISEEKSSKENINSSISKVDETKIPKPPNLTMPNLNLVDVSNSLKTSRNLIEEMVKETKHLLCDHDKNQRMGLLKDQDSPKSKIPAPNLKSSPKCTPRHSPRYSPKSSPRSSPRVSSTHIPNSSNMFESIDTVEMPLTAPDISLKKGKELAPEKVEEVLIIADVCPDKIREEEVIHNKEEVKANKNVRELSDIMYRPVENIKKSNLRRSPSPNQTPNDTKMGNIPRNLIYSEIPRPISPNNKHNSGRSPSPIQKDTLSKHLNYSEMPRSPSPGPSIVPTDCNVSKRNKLRNTFFSDIAPALNTSYMKQGISGRPLSPSSKVGSYPRNAFCSEIIRPVSPKNMKRITEIKSSAQNEFNMGNISRNPTPCRPDLPRPLSPKQKQRGNRNRSVSPCNIPISTSHRPRSPAKIFARPPSPRIPVRKEGREVSPLSFDQIGCISESNEPNIHRSQSKSPPRHDIGCSTSNYANPLSTQATQASVEHTTKTRWTINPELKKYQNCDYSFPREKWHTANPTASMPASNFYQVSDFCKQAPYLNRSLSPLPTPTSMRTENLRRILHAKDIATRINR